MNLVIAFPKKEVAIRIKQILQQSGYEVNAVCTTGAQSLSTMSDLDYGVLICGHRFVDMMYLELKEYMPKHFRMLLVASNEVVNEMDYRMDQPNVVPIPFKVQELLNALAEEESELVRYRKKMRAKPKERTAEEKQLIARAKQYLIDTRGMDEEAAHRYLQKRSMDNGTDIVETSHMIIQLMGKREEVLT